MSDATTVGVAYSSTQVSIVGTSHVQNSTNGTSPIEFDDDWLHIIQIVCLSVICLVGTVGNLMICYVLCHRKQKSSNFFILNLATTDLMVCAIGIPLDIYEQQIGTWPYGRFACRVIYPSQTLLILVSIMTLTAMSLERHRAIMYPLKHKMRKAAILLIIVFIWLLGFAVVTPYARILTYADGYCDELWPGDDDGKHYTLALFIIDYCIPLTIITYCYSRAGYELNKKFKQFQNRGNTFRNQNKAMRKRLETNKRIIKIFSFAVIMFVICMLPGDAYWMWSSFGDTSTFAYEAHFKTFTNILLYSNSAINPFIFGTCGAGCFRRKKRTLQQRRYLEVLNTTTLTGSQQTPVKLIKADPDRETDV